MTHTVGHLLLSHLSQLHRIFSVKVEMAKRWKVLRILQKEYIMVSAKDTTTVI